MSFLENNMYPVSKTFLSRYMKSMLCRLFTLSQRSNVLCFARLFFAIQRFWALSSDFRSLRCQLLVEDI